jgi:hypothetical protein
VDNVTVDDVDTLHVKRMTCVSHKNIGIVDMLVSWMWVIYIYILLVGNTVCCYMIFLKNIICAGFFRIYR